ncbi:MAG: efflux RND transporter permease subunit [Succiniclasticum sp.]|jgi:multidrug efflux pump|nr:efflux RND transporter permease subunit [Succiniclasticum sp.]MEE3479190.1 efflux RND transporter permease subunit [Succiniclasticum sp.]
MSSNWAEWSIKHKQVVYFFAALVAVMGIISYFTLGRQEDPNFAVKQMVISTSWPGATAKQMEMQVTDKIEKVAQTVPDVDYVTSYSRPGVSVVNVFLKNSTSSEQMKARWQEVRNLVSDNKRNLPSDIYGPYFDDHFDDVFGNVYAITSDSFSYEEMRRVASKIKDMFVQVPDVKKVELLGVQPEKVYIQVDNTKLSELGLSVDDLARVIAAETSVTPAAMKHDDTHNTYLRLTGIPDTVKNIESLPVSGNGRVMRLGDIAVIQRGYADPAEPKMYFNGKPCIGIAISMTDGGNNLRLGENLDKKIKEIRGKLPVGFEISQVLNQPQVVKNSINDFMESLLEAIAIVLVVSLMTLGRKSGYVISCCIPLVLTCSMVGMYLLGIDLHKVSLGALVIALGMLVDDSVVVVEMIENKINEGWDRIKACSFAFESCSKPLLTGTMITCSSFMPIAFAKSNVGEYAGSLFAVITVTLMSSWFIAATVAPTLAYQWIVPTNQGAAAGKKIAPEDNPLYQKPFYKKFRTVLRWALEHRKTVIAGAIAVFCAFLLLGTKLTQEFFPASVRPELLVELNLPEGSSLAASDKVAKQLTDIVLKDKDVASVSTYVGKSCPRFVLVLDPVLPRNNYAQLVVVAKDIDARKRMEKKITKIVEQQFPTVQTYSRSIPLGPPSPYPVMIRVSAPTDALAKEYADKLKQVMMANKKITMIRYDWMEKAPALKVELDDDKLRQMGLTRKTVSSALYAEISGYTVSQYYEGDQAIDMVFRLNPVDHSSIEEVGNLAIPTARGAVQLKQVAHLSYVNEDGMIWRRNLKPTVTVNAGIVSGVTGNDVTHEILDQSKTLIKNLPGGVTIEQDGSAEDSVEATESIMKPVPAMLVIMLVLLMIMLKDVRKLFVVVCTAPLGLIGVILGLFLFNTPLSVMAEIGALALVGTIIRNSTVLVDQIDQHLADGMTPYQAVVSSVIVRFRPIMLTALTTVLGLIPMFPSDFWRGLAIAMAAGLTVATMITLVIMPVLYCMVFHIPNEN